MKHPRMSPAWAIALLMLGLAPAPLATRTFAQETKPAATPASAPAKPAKPDRPADVFAIKLLSPQRAHRLNKKAAAEYELGLAALDKILYGEALGHFTAAIQAEPENVYLRFVAVQLAQYLGETRMGDDSIKYYDIAIDNLKEMADSPKLNAREKERARSVLETMTALRQTVTERDAKRRAYGEDLAKTIAAERFKTKAQIQKEKKAEEREQMKARFREAMRQAGRFSQAGGEQPSAKP